MRAIGFASVALALLLSLPAAAAPARKVADAVTLTPQQWSCLAKRLPSLLRQPADTVRVPLSSCDAGGMVRGGGLADPTVAGGMARAAPAAPLPPDVTKPPLYLSQGQLRCLQKQIGGLSSARGSVARMSFDKCGAN
jgi:hypothetical protein